MYEFNSKEVLQTFQTTVSQTKQEPDLSIEKSRQKLVRPFDNNNINYKEQKDLKDKKKRDQLLKQNLNFRNNSSQIAGLLGTTQGNKQPKIQEKSPLSQLINNNIQKRTSDQYEQFQKDKIVNIKKRLKIQVLELKQMLKKNQMQVKQLNTDKIYLLDKNWFIDFKIMYQIDVDTQNYEESIPRMMDYQPKPNKEIFDSNVRYDLNCIFPHKNMDLQFQMKENLSKDDFEILMKESWYLLKGMVCQSSEDCIEIERTVYEKDGQKTFEIYPQTNYVLFCKSNEIKEFQLLNQKINCVQMRNLMQTQNIQDLYRSIMQLLRQKSDRQKHLTIIDAQDYRFWISHHINYEHFLNKIKISQFLKNENQKIFDMDSIQAVSLNFNDHEYYNQNLGELDLLKKESMIFIEILQNTDQQWFFANSTNRKDVTRPVKEIYKMGKPLI